jgi:hypothetical protein
MIKNYKLGDTLLKTDYDNIIDKLDKMLKSTVLEEGKTVFFDKNVQTSRNEFKKQYPTNKIVHDLSKADYYISNNKLKDLGWNIKIKLIDGLLDLIK